MASSFSGRQDRRTPGHVLPETFDGLGIASNEPAGRLFKHFLGAALPDARNARVRFDRHDMIALIEQRIWIWRQVDPDPGDLHFGKRGAGGTGNGQSQG